MDPHSELGRSEAYQGTPTPCGLCGKPWEAFATDTDGVKLCQACAERPANPFDPKSRWDECMPPKDAAMLEAWKLLRNASAFQKLEGNGAKEIVSAARVVLRQAMGPKAYAATVAIEGSDGAFSEDRDV